MSNTNTDYLGLCVDCECKMTAAKFDDEFVCAACSNARYIHQLSTGKRIEIKFLKSDYRQGTYEEIVAVLARNKL